MIILPSANIRESQRALERLQVKLAADIAAAHSVPSFTASWGLTDTSAGDSLAEVLAVADAALYDAKRNGRNCIVVDGEAVNTLVRQQRDTGLTGALLAGFPEAPRPPLERESLPPVEEERLTRFDRDSGRPTGSRPLSTP